MVVVSSKRTDNQMLDPHGGEFNITARAEQLSSMDRDATFDLVFDFNGDVEWPINVGDGFYANVEILGLDPVGKTGPGNMNVWTGKLFFQAVDFGGLGIISVFPTGGAFALDPQYDAATPTTIATPSIVGDETYFSIQMTVNDARDFNWRAKIFGLWLTGDGIET